MAPESKQLTIAYAAGASLAAITLVYVFGPTFFIDGTGANASTSLRKRTVVGLYNPANDCFVNSVLQALAGLGILRSYLVGRVMLQYDLEQRAGEHLKDFRGRRPVLSTALKLVLDRLNERPIYKKTISSKEFLTELERVFRQRISRAQQDAQEFLQIVAQTIAEEYQAQEKLRRFVQCIESGTPFLEDEKQDGKPLATSQPSSSVTRVENGNALDAENRTTPSDASGGMPMEGKVEASIECMTCGFRPKPTISTFVALTLNVPQISYTTLDKCLNEFLATEYIDDFKCASCELRTAIELMTQQYEINPQKNQHLLHDVERLQQCLTEDPEKLPKDIKLPPLPKNRKGSRISRRTYLSSCPDILAIHLSRSIFDLASRKNSCKISFPETLLLGPILDKKGYKLLAVVTHKGGHESGHYECYRRQIVHPPPYSTPIPLYRAHGPGTSNSQADSNRNSLQHEITHSSSPSTSSQSSPPSTSTHASTKRTISTIPTNTLSHEPSNNPSATSASQSPKRLSPFSSTETTKVASKPHERLKKNKPNNRWWRISDEKIKEARTSDVLSLQKEVYLLFYEKDRQSF